MQQCPNCGQINRAGVVFCEFCGASLIGKQPLDTRTLGEKEEALQKQYGVDAKALTDVRAQGTSTFEQSDRLRLEIEGCPEPLFFELEREAIFGRKDPATGAMPDVDLTPFAGYRMGVSRRHAAISRNAENGLDVRDLGSSNGTFLNGQQLVAHRLYPLRNGDELRLGQMVIRVIFEPRQNAPSPPQEKKPTTKPTAQEPSSAQTLATQRPKPPTGGADAPQAQKAQPAAPNVDAQARAPDKAPPPPDARAAQSAQPPTEAPPRTTSASAPEEGTPSKPNAEDKDKRD